MTCDKGLEQWERRRGGGQGGSAREVRAWRDEGLKKLFSKRERAGEHDVSGGTRVMVCAMIPTLRGKMSPR